jgi:hypothetical protein
MVSSRVIQPEASLCGSNDVTVTVRAPVKVTLQQSLRARLPVTVTWPRDRAAVAAPSQATRLSGPAGAGAAAAGPRRGEPQPNLKWRLLNCDLNLIMIMIQALQVEAGLSACHWGPEAGALAGRPQASTAYVTTMKSSA